MTERAMGDPYRLHVKLGQAEFEAEGPEDVVKAQFGLFLEALRAQAPAAQPPLPPKQEVASNGSGGTHGQEHDAVLNRAFSVDGSSIVSLRNLPATTDKQNADSILLILYGYEVCCDQTNGITALNLMESARQSGLAIDRIDRPLAAYEAQRYYRMTGSKRGKRYFLTNPGRDHARRLMESL